MTMAEIRKWRGVPARRGMHVLDRHTNRIGVITGTASGYLRIRLQGNNFSLCYHPTWKLDYLTKDGYVLFESPN